MNKSLHVMIVMILIVTLLVSNVVPASASSFVPDEVDVCASLLVASGATFNSISEYRAAGYQYWRYLQDETSLSDDVRSFLASYLDSPASTFFSQGLIADVRNYLRNKVAGDDVAHLNFCNRFYKLDSNAALDWFWNLSWSQRAACYSVSSLYLKNFNQYNLPGSTASDSLLEALSTRGWWETYGSYFGRIGCADGYAVMFTYSGRYTCAYAIFCGDELLSYPYTSVKVMSTTLSSIPDTTCIFFSVKANNISSFNFQFLLHKAGGSSFSDLMSATIDYGSEHDTVPWMTLPTFTTPFDGTYSDGESSNTITIDTLIYMPTYTEVTETPLEKPITPESVRGDSSSGGGGTTDPDPAPDPKPEEPESVGDKIYNFIVPILGDIKAGLSDLVDLVGKIPPKIGDLLGGIGDDLAGIAAFLPTLLGILTGYTLFVTLFGHFLPEPVYLTVYAFFVATIVIYLIRWVANR